MPSFASRVVVASRLVAFILLPPGLLGSAWVLHPPSALADEGPTANGGPAYVDDAQCATCHADLFETYREVGMAKSFATAAAAEEVERLSTAEDPEAGRFFHEPSGRWYEMRRSDNGPVFRRWQVDAAGEPILEVELPVDWSLGSGHASRSYLVHEPGGELYMLPVSWYSQDGGHWAMSPGYDADEHLGLTSRVQRECMSCHNAYLDLPASTLPGRPPKIAASTDARRGPRLDDRPPDPASAAPRRRPVGAARGDDADPGRHGLLPSGHRTRGCALRDLPGPMASSWRAAPTRR